MATFEPFRPTSTIEQAMFNFDATGGTNYTLQGTISVAVSDDFVASDLQQLPNIDPELATAGAAKVTWSSTMLANVQDTLGILQQFANVHFNFEGYIGSVGNKNLATPADVGLAHLADVDISLISRSDVSWVGLSGGSTDDSLGYTGGAGDVYINSAFLGDASFGLNADARTTLMHELMHDLGLAHPHSDYNNGVPTITADYAQTRFLGFDKLGFPTATAADMYKEYFTIMSYDNHNVYEQAHTPMVLDVIALQQGYGEGTGSSGTGNDTITAGTAGYRVYFDKGGNDTIDLSQYTQGAYLHMGTNIIGASHLVGVAMSTADYTLMRTSTGPLNLRWLYGEFENAIGGSAADRLIGNALNNHISGMAGNDKIFGGAGNDVLDGGAGNDLLQGGPGNDVLNGAAGIDTADYSSALRGVTVNLAVTGAQNTVGAGSDTLISIEGLIGSNYADHLIGNGAANLLNGGKGDDVLAGGAGNDTLNGGAGNDRLSGGAGSDIFLFDLSAAGGVDQILDFNPATDKIDLDNALFTRLGKAGALPGGELRASSNGIAHDSNDFVLYNGHTGALFYDPDGNGPAHEMQFATLYDSHGGHPAVSQLLPIDFVIV